MGQRSASSPRSLASGPTAPSGQAPSASGTAGPAASKYAPTLSKGPKDQHDKFYTKTSVAQECLDRLDLPSYDRVIEPSAGGGAFSDLLFATPALNVIALDLVPENQHVQQQDWFTFTTTHPGRTLVVGNPPFGRQSSLAVRFINHAFEVVGAHTVAFILPRGFVKASVQDRVFRNARLVGSWELPKDSFTLHGKDYSLPTVFQVWERCDAVRPTSTGSTSSQYFDFVDRADAEVAIRRVGGKAGHAFKPAPDTSKQSNYFIRRKKPPIPGMKRVPTVTQVIGLINTIDYSGALTATGPDSLSKRDLVSRLDAAFKGAYVA
jgi:hypothetical protein